MPQGTFSFEVRPLELIKEPRIRGCEAQTFSRVSVKFLRGNPRGMRGINEIHFTIREFERSFTKDLSKWQFF